SADRLSQAPRSHHPDIAGRFRAYLPFGTSLPPKPESLSLPVEAMVFVAHEHRDWSLGLFGLFKGHRNPRRISTGFYEVVVNPEGMQEALGVRSGGILGDAVPSPPAVSNHQHHRNIQAQSPAAERVAGFHQASILNKDDRGFPTHGETSRHGKC